MKQLATSTQIDDAVAHLATKLITDVGDSQPLFVALLRGAMPFASKLMFEITKQAPNMHPELDYMMTSTYGDGRTTREPRIITDLSPSTNIQGRTAVVLDDVLDKGVTAHLVREHLLSRGAQSVVVAVLVEKGIERTHVAHADYACFHVGPEWLVGMGLDDAATAKEGYRWLTDINIVS